MPTIRIIISRRSGLLALAALAAMLAAAALSLTPVRANDEDMLPSDAAALALPSDLALELSLVNDSDNIVPPGGSGTLEAFLTYSGPLQEEELEVSVLADSNLRGNVEWGSSGGPRVRLPAQDVALDDREGACTTIPQGERGGDPEASNYGMDVDSGDDINRCPIALHDNNTSERFEVFEDYSSVTITATILLAAGERAHKAHPDGLTPISGDIHYPRAAVTLRASLDVAVAEVNEVSSVNLDVAQTCGEAAADRGTHNAGSGTVQCRTLLPAENDQTTLILSILNENGKAAASGSIASAFISSSLGELSIGSSTPGSSIPVVDTTSCGRQTPLICQIDASSLNAANSGSIPVVLKHADVVGTAMVTATVLDSKGNPFRSPTVEIILAGPAAGFTISEPTGALTNRATEDDDLDTLRLTVSGADKAGNPAPLLRRGPRAVIRDADGKTVSSGITTDWTDGSALPTHGGQTVVNITVTANAEQPLKAGAYTLELRTAGFTGKQTFTVAGPPAVVTLGEPQGTLEVGSTMTITAAVNDADGNPVPDGTPISWSDSSIEVSGSPIAQKSRSTTVKNGEASASYLVLTAGRTTLIASAGGVNDVKLISVGSPAVPPPAEGLAGQGAGFQGYVGRTPTTASALLADLPNISGVLLRRAGEWVRYGLVNGRVVPGSIDFDITRGDVLWLSGS